MNQKTRTIANYLVELYDFFINGCYHVSAWMVLVIALSIGYEVFVRYFFNRPTKWAGDFVDYMMLYSTLLASAWLLKNDSHVKMTFLVEYLSPRSRIILGLINSVIGICVCGLIAWYGLADTLEALEKGIFIARPIVIPRYIIIGVIPFGFILLLVQFVRNFFKFLITLKSSSRIE